jgi:hypothetical protein
MMRVIRIEQAGASGHPQGVNGHPQGVPLRNGVVRCPWCAGLRVLIDRFNHMRSDDCPLCRGRGKVMIYESKCADEN